MASVDRRLPVGGACFQESPQAFRERRTQQSALQLAVTGIILKLQEHGVHAQDGVLVAPRLGPASEHPVLERTAPQRCESGIYAGGVRPEHGQAGRVGPGDDPGGDIAKSMHSQLPVLRQKRGTEKRGQLAGGGTAHQIHLEEPILTMQITEGPCEVRAIASRQGRNTGGVALDGHGGGESRKFPSAIDDGKTGTQREPGGREGCEHQDSQRSENSRQMRAHHCARLFESTP